MLQFILRGGQLRHYYGNIVRVLFLVGALVMVIGLPVVKNYLTFPVLVSVVGILFLALCAGFTNPRLALSAYINTFLSCVAFVVFEYFAVVSFEKYGAGSKFFVANLLLGLLFMFAVYFSVKTVRGLLVSDNTPFM